jgi:ATP-GRASP peptide maturase of grasp-with-spasm system
MVLIISYDNGSTNIIIDWLISKNIIVHRLNPYFDNVKVREIQIASTKPEIELEFEVYNSRTKLSDYTGIWVWHGLLRFSNCETISTLNSNKPAVEILKKSLSNHHEVLINYISEYISNFSYNAIGNYRIQGLNKLEVLLKAKKLGIDTPDTHIISSKQQLSTLLEDGELITKPYYEVAYPIYHEKVYQNYTSEISDLWIKEKILDENFFPSLVQKKINKFFEIRSFFLKHTFYSMAIFSQASLKTEIDFRNYNFENPNRTVPFTLPTIITKKLKKLFKILNLNSGSVDLIYTTDDKYIFLEINPVGQFGMVSTPCNYHLEHLIAETLINGRN